MSRKKILVVSNMVKGEGISELVFKYYSKIAQDGNFKIELLTESHVNEFKDELENNGIKTHMITSMKKNFVQYIKDWKRLIKDNNYDFIHLHTDNYMRFIPYVLMKSTPSKLIVHSHNSQNSYISNSSIKRIINGTVKNFTLKYPFKHVACSKHAAKWMFGDQDYQLIYNGIDVANYQFNLETRSSIRKQLNIDDRTVLYGHIGRFKQQKNHSKLLSIFNEIYKKEANSKLLLIGEGPLKDEIKSKVSEYGLSDNVIFMNYTAHVNDYLNAMDVVIFPSLYEGFPISLVEAQANGLPIFYSDKITDEIELLPTTQKIDIEDDSHRIANFILDYKNTTDTVDRKEASKTLIDLGFDVENSIHQIEELYK